MLTLPDMLDLFVNEFSRLRGRRFPFACIFARPLDRFLFRHSNLRNSRCT
jgi:hypothetical protein